MPQIPAFGIAEKGRDLGSQHEYIENCWTGMQYRTDDAMLLSVQEIWRIQ